MPDFRHLERPFASTEHSQTEKSTEKECLARILAHLQEWKAACILIPHQAREEREMHHNEPEPAVSPLTGESSERLADEHVRHSGADHHDPALSAWEDEGGAVA